MNPAAFIPDIERQSKQTIKKYQEERLQQLLQYLQANSPFYQRLFKKHRIEIAKIQTLEDLAFIPTTSKDDLQLHNMDFLAVPPVKVIDYITTSGTLGDPVTFAATDKDLERLAYNEYLSFTSAGGTAHDIYQLMVTIDKRFMAGLAYFLGIRKLGAGVVRVGPGNPELQLDSLKRFNATSLVTVPSFLLKLIQYAEDHDIDFRATSVKSAICIGEPIRNAQMELNALGQQVKDKWDIELYSTYASTEMAAAFTECKAGAGGHHHPELLIIEFLDENERPVKPGEMGELTVTTLGVEGMPLLRFKTGDICAHYETPCSCGRTTVRLGPVMGRKNQMIKYKGTTLYPSSLYDILNDIQGVDNYVVKVTNNSIGTDDINIIVGSTIQDKTFEKTIKDHFRAKLRVAPSIEFLTPYEVDKLKNPPMTRKPLVFIDERNK
jgi:phenylacetate-CoA ligase